MPTKYRTLSLSSYVLFLLDPKLVQRDFTIRVRRRARSRDVHRLRRRFWERHPDNSRPVSWNTFTWTGKRLSSDANSMLHRPMTTLLNSSSPIVPYSCSGWPGSSELYHMLLPFLIHFSSSEDTTSRLSSCQPA